MSENTIKNTGKVNADKSGFISFILKHKNIIYFLCILTMILIFVFSLLLKYREKLDLDAKEALIEEELQKQKNTQKALKDEMNNGDDPKYIEKMARERLNMVKPNEIVFNDTGADNNSNNNTNNTTNSEQAVNNDTIEQNN